jgi:DNA modification methylase
MTWEVRHGDCRDIMKTLDADSIDAIVSDPPYGLSFMGREWDKGVPGVEFWIEAFRVLKPGGYLLAFSGTRTYHRQTCAIEDSGFEIRDCIAWVYGSGFPKSHNVGLAIDKKAGHANRGRAIPRASSHTPEGKKLTGLEVEPYTGKTEDGKKWAGFGTALKPAFEPIVMARKPLAENTVAENVLKYGTGALNIDACRIEHEEEQKIANRTGRSPDAVFNDKNSGLKSQNNVTVSANPAGRWPANFIHDGSEEVMERFPDVAGSCDRKKSENKTDSIYGKYKENSFFEGYNDTGSAGRFFYTAKCSKADRNEGLEEFEEKLKAFNGSSDKSSPGADRSGSLESKFTSSHKNNHPTVKPTDLMRHLCKMVTPPGGVILDPFNGSGSTGKAAVLEGFNYIGCELSADYVELSKARISYAEKNRAWLIQPDPKPPEDLKKEGQITIFDFEQPEAQPAFEDDFNAAFPAKDKKKVKTA